MPITDASENEAKLTLAELGEYHSIVLNKEKEINRNKFERRGQNRRQDHGTVGNSIKRYYRYVQRKLAARRRRDFRASGQLS